MRERSRPATLTRSPTKSLGKTPRLLPTLIKIVSATEGSIVTRGDFSVRSLRSSEFLSDWRLSFLEKRSFLSERPNFSVFYVRLKRLLLNPEFAFLMSNAPT